MTRFQTALNGKGIRYVFLVVALHFWGSAFAQISTDYNTYKAQYPNAQSVRLKQHITLNISLNEGQFDITQESTEEDLYLYENAKYDSKQSLSFSSFYELKNVEASSFVIKDGTYEELKVSDFKIKDELDTSFYDDIKSINFIYPGLGQGAKTRLHYTQRIKNPRFLNSVFFGGYYPIENNSFTIVADKRINLRFQEFNMEGIPYEFTTKETRKNKIYTWQLNTIDEFQYEKDAPSYKSILPHIIPIIESYEDDGERVALLEDVNDLYRWYYSLIEHVNANPPAEELVQLVAALTANKANELEKVRSIYYWVQENIKYIAFEYALGGFVPREANTVFAKKYGDCKDNSSLLLTMLDIAGIQGNLTWIGTRTIPYSYKEVPTPSVDNHMILHYEYEGKSYFLDATGRFTPMETPTSFIQGKEALVAMGKDSFSIKKVPMVAAIENLFEDKTVVTLDDSDLKGKSQATISGYGKSDLFYQLEKATNKTRQLELYNRVFRKGNNSFQVTQFTEGNKYSYDKDFEVDYDFVIPNYAKRLGDEIYLNLNLKKPLRNVRTRADRVFPFEHEYMDAVAFETIFDIPEGYVVDYLPEGITVSCDYLDSSIRYELVGNQIKHTHTFQLKALVLDIEAQKEVNALVRKVEQQYKEVVVLKKN
ncbi:MAG: DUF3857 domain-containing protein [Bacteroidota bacterium]